MKHKNREVPVRVQGILWKFRDFAKIHQEGELRELFFVPNEQLAILMFRVPTGPSDYSVQLQLWVKRNNEEFIGALRLDPLKGNSAFLDYNSDLRLLLAVGASGELCLVNLKNWKVTHTGAPPVLIPEDPVYAVQLAPDGNQALAFHENRVILHEFRRTRNPSKPGRARAYQLPTTPGVYPSTWRITKNFAVIADIQGTFTWVRRRRPLSLLQINVGESQIFDDFTVDEAGVVRASAVGNSEIYRIDPRPGLTRPGHGEVNAQFWRPHVRFSPPTLAEFIFLGGRLHTPPFNPNQAAASRGIPVEKLQTQIAEIIQALTVDRVKPPTEGEAYQIFRYANPPKQPKRDLSGLLVLLKTQAQELAQVTGDPFAYGSLTYLLITADSKVSNFNADFNGTIEDIKTLQARTATFKARVWDQIDLFTFGRPSPPSEAFLHAFAVLQERGWDRRGNLWTLLIWLVLDKHPILKTPLTEEEIFSAIEGVLQQDRRFGDGSLNKCWETYLLFKEIIDTLARRAKPVDPERHQGPFPSFAQANTLLYMAREDGKDWKSWLREWRIPEEFDSGTFAEAIESIKRTRMTTGR